jgi:hypothetical protein
MSPSSARPSGTPSDRRCARHAASAPERSAVEHRDPTLAQVCDPRVRCAAIPQLGLPEYADPIVARDYKLAAKAIEQQALDQLVGHLALAIEQQIAAPARPYEEVEQRLALRREEPGVDGQRAGHVIRDKPLEERGGVLPISLGGDADEGAIEEELAHREEVAHGGARIKPCLVARAQLVAGRMG